MGKGRPFGLLTDPGTLRGGGGRREGEGKHVGNQFGPSHMIEWHSKGGICPRAHG